MIADRRSQIAISLWSSAIIWKHTSAIVCDHLRSIAIVRSYGNQSFAIRDRNASHNICVLSHDSTLVCLIVATVSVATLISLSSWLRLSMSTLVTRHLWRKLHAMNVFKIATAKILGTSTKRPTVGTKSARSLIYQPGKRRPSRNIRTAYGRYQPTRACIFDTSTKTYGYGRLCDRCDYMETAFFAIVCDCLRSAICDLRSSAIIWKPALIVSPWKNKQQQQQQQKKKNKNNNNNNSNSKETNNKIQKQTGECFTYGSVTCDILCVI